MPSNSDPESMLSRAQHADQSSGVTNGTWGQLTRGAVS